MRAPVSALVVVVAALACASETAPPGQRTFRDEAGRTCTVDVADAMAVATCDVSPPDPVCLDTVSCFCVRVAAGALRPMAMIA